MWWFFKRESFSEEQIYHIEEDYKTDVALIAFINLKWHQNENVLLHFAELSWTLTGSKCEGCECGRGQQQTEQLQHFISDHWLTGADQ